MARILHSRREVDIPVFDGLGKALPSIVLTIAQLESISRKSENDDVPWCGGRFCEYLTRGMYHGKSVPNKIAETALKGVQNLVTSLIMSSHNSSGVSYPIHSWC